jgi:putative ABC transport system ATP-binding protein
MNDVASMPGPGPSAPPTLPSTEHFAAYCRSASKFYGEGDTQVRALNDVTVGFETGVFTSIMGPSGSGKSTLMQCMAGLDTLTSGETYVGSVELSSLKDKQLTELRRSKIGFIFQAYNLIPTLTAKENITLPLDLAGANPDHQWLDQVIDAVGLADRMGHRPNELSGGQQQRVAVARALASRPAIIFGDEPTGNLDSRSGAEILDFMQRAVQEFNQTIVMVTHDPVSASYSDRVLFLSDGEIVDEMENPTADGVFDKMRHLGD